MPRNKKTPTDIGVSAEVTPAQTTTPKRIRKPGTASTSPTSRGRAAKKDTTASMQATTESVTSIAASSARNSQTNLEQLLQSAVSRHEQIALLAYSYWQARGCRGGSPEEDWYRAESEIRNGTGEAVSD
jgi:hypothetical protein